MLVCRAWCISQEAIWLPVLYWPSRRHKGITSFYLNVLKGVREHLFCLITFQSRASLKHHPDTYVSSFVFMRFFVLHHEYLNKPSRLDKSVMVQFNTSGRKGRSLELDHVGPVSYCPSHRRKSRRKQYLSPCGLSAALLWSYIMLDLGLAPLANNKGLAVGKWL